LGSGDVAVQETLVSGTNIKTLNNTSLLGSGNITLTANPSGVAGAIQFSDGSAFASDAANFFWNNTTKRLGVGTNVPATTLDILPPVQTATATQFDCMRVGYSNSTIGVTNGSALQVQVATTGSARYSTTLRLSGSSDTSQAYLKGFASNNFGVMLNRTNSNLGLFSDNGIKLGDTVFAGQDGAASAMVHIKGSGSTSATTSLLVQNSAGAAALQVKDNGDVGNTPASGVSWLLNNVGLSLSSGGIIDVAGSGSSNTRLNAGASGNAAVGTTTNHAFSFLTNNSARGQISTTGQWLIGAYSTSYNICANLEIRSTTQGVLFPRVTTTQKNAISTPLAGLLVFDTTLGKLSVHNGTAWETITSV
jgi:hypothetical protein